MSVNYNIPTINDRLADVVSNIDAGSSFGKMRLLSQSAGTVSIITLQKPSGTVGAGILTFSELPLGGATLLSTNIVAADIEDSTGIVVVSGLTVGQSTSYDIFMGTTLVDVGQTVTLTSATITGV